MLLFGFSFSKTITHPISRCCSGCKRSTHHHSFIHSLLWFFIQYLKCQVLFQVWDKVTNETDKYPYYHGSLYQKEIMKNRAQTAIIERAVLRGNQVKQQTQSAKVDREVLGAMRPHFQPIHERLSNRSPDEAEGQTVSCRKDQWTSGQHRIQLGLCSQHALFSLVILKAVSVILSVMNGIDVIIPANPIFVSNILS